MDKRIARGDIPINKLDNYCLTHDLQYQKFRDSKNRSVVDKVLETQALERLHLSDASIREKIAALGTAAIMGAKRKLGMSMKKSQTNKGKGLRRKRIIPTPKRGGFLPLLLSILGALEALGVGLQE